MPARFTFVTYYWHPYVSGLTLHVSRVAEGLAAAGAEVEAVVARHQPELPARERIAGVDVRRVPVRARFDRAVIAPGLLPAVAAAARRSDVVVAVTPMAEAAPLALAVRPQAKLCVYHICDAELQPSPLSGAIMRVADASARTAVRLADRVVASSADYAAHSRILRARSREVAALPPPIELDAFHRDGAAPREGGSRPRVGFLGRLTFEKGLDRLIRAAAQMEPQPELVLAGDSDGVAGGGEAAALRRLAADLGVTLRLLGRLDDEELPGFYRSLDVFALPSVNSLEAWGMVQVESMLCGTPVVCSALPGVREVMQRAGMGLTVPPGDVEALARGLEQVLRAPSEHVRPRDQVIRSLGLDTVVGDHVETLLALAR